MQEQDGLETALQKAIFSRKEEQQYMPVLHENHIHKDTEFFMIQCYFPANKDIQADDKFDNTQFFYRFIRQCQQIFAEKKVLSVIFQRDLYITLVAKMPTGTERENVIQQIFMSLGKTKRQKYLSGRRTRHKQTLALNRQYQKTGKVSRKNAWRIRAIRSGNRQRIHPYFKMLPRN